MKSFEVAVKAPSSRDTDLLVAERAVYFILNKLDGSMSDTGPLVPDLIHLVECWNKPSFISQARDHLECSNRQNVANSAIDLLKRLLPLEIEDNNTEARDPAGQTQECTTLAHELNEFICS